MSRREGRETKSKRSSHSKIEREPSPKRSRRDGKPKAERNISRNYDLDTLHDNDQDKKLRRRLQDALPLEAPIEAGSKVGPDHVKSKLEKKTNEKENDVTRHSSDPTEVLRSRSFFQHDECGVAGQGGQSFNRRPTTERGWSIYTKDRSSEKPEGNEMNRWNLHKRDEKTQAEGDDNNVWCHDRFHEGEADVPPAARKRPAFREKKTEQESGTTTGVNTTEFRRSSHLERPASENARREEWGGRHPYQSDRFEKPSTVDRAPSQRRETHRVGFSSRERYGGGGSIGRDRFSGKYGERNQNNNIHTEKWKHDMFDEANKSPSPKNTEDQIAKVEALLAL